MGALAGVEAGTTNMTDVSEVLPASPDLRPLAEAAPLPDVEEAAVAAATAETAALDKELDVWKRIRRLPRPTSAQDLGRQVACLSEEDVMEGRGRRVLSCVSTAEGARVADEEEEEDDEEAEDEEGTDADTEAEDEEAVGPPRSVDERLDQLELDIWNMMAVSVPVPLGVLCAVVVGMVAWMTMTAVPCGALRRGA